jgi:hypothetical protein
MAIVLGDSIVPQITEKGDIRSGWYNYFLLNRAQFNSTVACRPVAK